MEHYYQLLGVSKNSSPAEIKQKFRQIQLEMDGKNSNNNEIKIMYKKICDAYSILSNEKLKDEYDKNLERDIIVKEADVESHINSKTVDLFTVIGEQLLNNVIKNVSNLEHQSTQNTLSMPFNMSNMSNMPNLNVQSIKDVGQNEHIEIPPLIQILPVTYLQAYTGCILPIEIERKIYTNETTKSFSTEKETVYINIPKGIDNNEILFFSNKGHGFGNYYGELKVNIQLINHEKYKRDGLHLNYTKTLTLKEALCGCTFMLEHLIDKSFKISTHGNIINPNHKQIIPNLGFQRMDCAVIGDLVINFEIIFPDNLSNEDIDMLKTVLP